jgi:branched-chain amino acid aminotransferase
MKGAAHAGGRYVALDDAVVSTFDLGLVNGDTVYDVVSVHRRYFFKLDAHLDRFERSAAAWRMTIPYRRDEIREILGELVDRAGFEDAYVKVQLTRGRARGDFWRDLRRAEQEFIAFAIPYIWLWGKAKAFEGGSLHLSRIERISAAAIDPTVKNYCRADMAQAQLDALERGCDDAVLLGPDGNVTEGIGWNVLAVRDGSVITARDNVLTGVTREAVLELCAAEGIPYQLRALSPEEMISADEVFVSSTAGGVMPVLRIDDATIGGGYAGAITKRIQELYWAKRAEGWHGTPVDELVKARGGATR